jgi:hypothetical protein
VYGGDESYKDEAIEVQRCDGGSATTIFTASADKPDLFVWLDNAWMASKGEMQQDWRILIADDFCWSPFQLTHALTSLIDGFSSTQGWSGSHVTFGQGSGVMTIAVSGGVGSAVKTYDEDASQYRRLRLRAKVDSAPATFRVRLNGSQLYWWDVPLSTTMSDTVLDLCAPAGASATSDLTDSSDVAPGEFYGPRKITSVAFENLTDGKTYTIDKLEFARTGGASYTALPPFDESVVGEDGARRYRLSWGLCDKRQVFDLPYRVDDASGDRFLTVADLMGQIRAHDAYSVVGTLPPPGEANQFYYDHAHRPAAFMATERHVAGVRQNVLDIAMDVPAQVRWLMRFDKVTVYPGIGTPGGSFGGAYPLRFTKRLQMAAHGLVVDTSAHHSQAGATVSLKQGGTVLQTAVTDAYGYYRVGPHCPLAGPFTIGTSASGDVVLPSGLTDRKYRWAGLKGAAAVHGHTAATCDRTGRLYIAYTDAAGVMCRRVDVLGNAHDTVVTSAASGAVGIAWAAPHRLWVIFSQSAGIGLRTSFDDGATWGGEVAIFASGDYPNVLADPATGLLFAFRHDGTGIRSRRSVDGGATWATEVAVVSSCPAQQCGVTVRPDLAGTLFVTYKDAAGAIQIVSSRDNGMTWG